MRRSIIVLLLFVAGCGKDTAPDTAAARAFVRSKYSASHITLTYDLVEEPEYATIPKIPRDHIAPGFPDRAAACGVRVKFTWKTGNSTTRDDWIVWVSSDHKGVGFSPNPSGDNWRQLVQSAATK
jgi:hypothetical protein